MKKSVLTLFAIVALSIIVTSCATHEACDAYGNKAPLNSEKKI